jgi:SLA1 homology domain 1, SHD1
MRTWVDNTGRFSCEGRLVRFMDGYVRLMKDNGHTTTVPVYRLSANDLSFVNRQASAQPQATFAQAENAEAAEVVTAN